MNDVIAKILEVAASNIMNLFLAEPISAVITLNISNV